MEQAALRLGGDVVRTRAALSRTLSAITGAEIIVKFENEQFTGSFKDRGAANRLRLMEPAERDVGVVAMSAGGIGVRGLAQTIVGFSFLFALLAAFLTLYVSPEIAVVQETLRNRAEQ